MPYLGNSSRARVVFPAPLQPLMIQSTGSIGLLTQKWLMEARTIERLSVARLIYPAPFWKTTTRLVLVPR